MSVVENRASLWYNLLIKASKGDKLVRGGIAFETLKKRGVGVFEYETVGSTNTEARVYAQSGGIAPALFLAREQTEGRGRMGRSFYSPRDTGLYMTLLLDVTGDAPSSAVRLTTCAAVATARAVEECTDISVGIKWVNDIYIDEKKICGILAESFIANDRRYVMIGVGINLSTKAFPDEIAGIAASLGLDDASSVVGRLADSIGANLMDIYESVRACDTSYIDEYKRRSVVLGRAVTYTAGDKRGSGIAEDIDENGALYVRLEDGSREILNSGEISLRIKKEDEK